MSHELLANRLRLWCPPEHLDRRADYSEWFDLDGLAVATSMQLDEPTPPAYNAVISLCSDMLHRPALDLDGKAWVTNGVLTTWADEDERQWHELGTVTLIPSTHNQHGYGDQPMTWGSYRELLVEMRDAGALGRGFVSLAARRGFTLLRAPGTRKGGS